MTNENIPAWKISRSAWKAQQGIHEPWICEISLPQYAGLSGRGKRAYDAKRTAEWEASAEGSRRYSAEVLAALERGEYSEPEAHCDAKECIRAEAVRRREREHKNALEQAVAQNRVEAADIKKGDRVFSVFYGYGTVIRISRMTIRVQFPAGHCQTGPANRFQKLSHDDMTAALEVKA